jgi:hypothetical protein
MINCVINNTIYTRILFIYKSLKKNHLFNEMIIKTNNFMNIMGGNAIKINGQSLCTRMSKNVYIKLRNFIVTYLSKYFYCEILTEFINKNDH